MENKTETAMAVDFVNSDRGYFYDYKFNETIDTILRCKSYHKDSDKPFQCSSGAWFKCFSSKKPEPGIVLGDFIMYDSIILKVEGMVHDCFALSGANTFYKKSCTRLPEELQIKLKKYFKEVG